MLPTAGSDARCRSSFLTRVLRLCLDVCRFGRKGVAINFVRDDDIRVLRDIEMYYSTQIDEMPINISEMI